MKLVKDILNALINFLMWYFRGHDEKFARRGIALFIIGILLIPASMYCYQFYARAKYQSFNNLPPQSTLASTSAPTMAPTMPNSPPRVGHVHP